MLLRATLDDLRLAAQPLTDGEAGDYDAVLKLIGDARVVSLGVSSQGTHEFFRARAELTTRLIKETGFTAATLPTTRRSRPVGSWLVITMRSAARFTASLTIVSAARSRTWV